VDVVLNSLARELVDASLALLPRGGRFVELGKTDLRDAGAIAARHPGVRYEAFDLMAAGWDRLARGLADLSSQLGSGELAPLPLAAVDARRARDAVRTMA